jgi:hypothetical protein
MHLSLYTHMRRVTAPLQILRRLFVFCFVFTPFHSSLSRFFLSVRYLFGCLFQTHLHLHALWCCASSDGARCCFSVNIYTSFSLYMSIYAFHRCARLSLFFCCSTLTWLYTTDSGMVNVLLRFFIVFFLYAYSLSRW